MVADMPLGHLQDAASVTADVLNAIHYLHSIGITHRDLKVGDKNRTMDERCHLSFWMSVSHFLDVCFALSQVFV